MPNVKETLRDAMLNGTPGQRKAVLKELVVEVRVESRDSIIPTFRLPAAPVRVTEAVVGRGGLEPPTSALDLAERCANEYPHLESGERHAPSYVVRLAPDHSFLRLLVPTPISLLPRLITLSTVLVTMRVPNLIRGVMWCGPPSRRTQLEAMKRLIKFEYA